MANMDELKESADAKARERIKEAWDLFDKEKRGVIIQEEVPTIMRYLDCYVSDKDVVEKVLPDIQEDEPTAFVTYDKFEKKMLAVMESQEFSPDTEDTLLQAFRVIDKEKRGYIEADKLRELLLKHGTAFREKEIEALMNDAKDIETGLIYYEDYVALLTGVAAMK